MSDIFKEANNEHKRNTKYKYLKGLLIRIILSCLLFLALYLCRLFGVEVYEYNTDKVMEKVADNTAIERIEDTVANWIK
ncbi:MAG: hypothetical protein E7256_16175 [Lachnospiraceae bacterium]|nr:hypothetical protein [Lachnospiraceae bacterium]